MCQQAAPPRLKPRKLLRLRKQPEPTSEAVVAALLSDAVMLATFLVVTNSRLLATRSVWTISAASRALPTEHQVETFPLVPLPCCHLAATVEGAWVLAVSLALVVRILPLLHELAPHPHERTPLTLMHSGKLVEQKHDKMMGIS